MHANGYGKLNNCLPSTTRLAASRKSNFTAHGPYEPLHAKEATVETLVATTSSSYSKVFVAVGINRVDMIYSVTFKRALMSVNLLLESFSLRCSYIEELATGTQAARVLCLLPLDSHEANCPTVVC